MQESKMFALDLQVNLAMMLETEYLNRQNAVTEAVKRKLDYQVHTTFY